MTRRKTIIGSLLAVAVLSSVVTFGASQIYPTSFNNAKNAIVNVVQKASSLTGFYDKKLWDWFELLAVPILIVIIGYQLEQRDKRKAGEQVRLEREIANNNLAEEAIQAYLERMSALLLNKEFRKDLFPNVNYKLNPSGYDNPVRNVARMQTTTILRRLERDKERQARIINFLRDSELYKFIFQNANLSKIDLSQANLYEVNLQGADLEFANLQEVYLYRTNLQGASLKETNLQRANLAMAELQGANLHRANLQGVDLDRANLQDAHLEETNLQGASLKETNLQQANLAMAELQGANLHRANLQGADLEFANLQDADLEGAKLQGAHLEGANLQETRLQEAKLQDADLEGAKLQDTDLELANLQDTDLEFAKLQDADLEGAKLQDADLYRANLQQAHLKGANLQQAHLKGANLQQAHLEGTNLQQAHLEGTNLQDAYLMGTEKLTPKQIKSACFWDKAVYKGEWNKEKQAWVAMEPDNTNFIKELKNDKASDPVEKPDCSVWENSSEPD